MFAGSQTHLPVENAPFLARLTSVATGTGTQAGLYLYGFVEQTFDPTTGLPQDASPARTGDPATATYAVEVDNQLVPGLTATPPTTPLPAWTTPLPSPMPYPYAWMRLKGVVNGAPVYEFELPAMGLQWVKPTSGTLANITLSGGVIQGYQAQLLIWSSLTGSLSPGAAVWITGINAEIPADTLPAFQCRYFGADTSGKGIWTFAMPLPLASATQAGIASLGSVGTAQVLGVGAKVVQDSASNFYRIRLFPQSGAAFGLTHGSLDGPIVGLEKPISGATSNLYLVSDFQTSNPTLFLVPDNGATHQIAYGIQRADGVQFRGFTGTGGAGDGFVGGICVAAGGGGSSLVIGTTTISGGTSGNLLYDNAGKVGETNVIDGGTW